MQDGQKINIIYETGDDDVKLNFALVQLHAETKVQRGENAGSTLRHVNVVRDFITIDPAQKNADVQLLLPLGVTKSDCTVVAFVQNGKSWKITAAAKCGIQ